MNSSKLSNVSDSIADFHDTTTQSYNFIEPDNEDIYWEEDFTEAIFHPTWRQDDDDWGDFSFSDIASDDSRIIKIKFIGQPSSSSLEHI